MLQLKNRPEMISNPVSTQDIEALIDAQLTKDEERMVLAEITHNPFLRKQYMGMLEQKRLLQMWWESELSH